MMELTKEEYRNFVEILKEELTPAFGCTEPIAIAYCAAKARETLGCLPEKVVIEASGNIIKNVKSVIVPNTGRLKGIPAAAAAGIVAGEASKILEVIAQVSDVQREQIREYLEQRAGADALFAASCAKEHKNLDDCITFILNYVQQSGCNGFTDAEIYSLAVHYYDEDDIDVGKPLDCRVVVNHTIVLTEEEQREAHEQALRKATEEAYAKITHKSKSQPASNAANAANQQSLF